MQFSRTLTHTDRVWLNRAAAIEHTRHTNMQDVKELVPEFFSLPDFLSNISALDLGCCAHSGKRYDGGCYVCLCPVPQAR